MMRQGRKNGRYGRWTGGAGVLCCAVAVMLTAGIAGPVPLPQQNLPLRHTHAVAQAASSADARPIRAVVTQFTGQRKGKDVQLHWVTARESGNRGFEVQRASSLSRGWERITFVPGFGSSRLDQDYHVTDRDAPPEDVRYMLRIIGDDGMVQYSQIISVPAGSMLRTFTAEPVSEQEDRVFRASVELTEGGVTALSVIDHKGLTLLRVMAATRLDAGRHDFIVDCSKVPRGEYTLMLHIPEGRYTRRLFVP